MKTIDISEILLDTREIRTDSTLSLRSPKSKWKLVSHKVQDVSHWKNNELTTQCFTGRASFQVLQPGGKIKSRGECLNINQKNTLARKYFGENFSKSCLKLSHERYKYLISFLNIIKCVLTLLVLNGYFNLNHVYYISILWLFIPIHVLMIANVSILKRVWLKSFLPWMHLYVALIETYSFCSLCNWDLRTLMVGPPMLLSQLSITNYDAVYFRRENKIIITIHIIFALIWKMSILLGMRFNYFENIYVNKIVLLKTGTNNLYLDNLSLYASKTTSMMMFLFGQLVFRCRHPDKAYSIRTNYTIRSNKEWMDLNRKNRIQKKKTLKDNVENTHEVLEDVDGGEIVKIIV